MTGWRARIGALVPSQGRGSVVVLPDPSSKPCFVKQSATVLVQLLQSSRPDAATRQWILVGNPPILYRFGQPLGAPARA
ncbi:MAG: hypothetical protein RQ966_00995 [Acetobacteraceae bacterium]|nr:hypothetical protein [Acetobacteraceae bacterium]